MSDRPACRVVSITIDGEPLDEGIVPEGDALANWIREAAHNYEAAFAETSSDPTEAA